MTIDPTESPDWDCPPDDADVGPDDAAPPRLVERVLLRVTNLFIVRSGSDSLVFSGRGVWMTLSQLSRSPQGPAATRQRPPGAGSPY